MTKTRTRRATPQQEETVIAMYQNGAKIKDIIKATQLGSQQTVYRILNDHNIPRHEKKYCPLYKTIAFEDDVAGFIESYDGNVSAFVCECIRKEIKAAR